MARRRRLWRFDDREREVLYEAALKPSVSTRLLAVVVSAERRADLGGMWVVEATARELDEMYDFVEGLMGRTRSEERRELLEGLLAGLSACIDGF